MAEAYLNRIETAVPPYDVHGKFVEFAPSLLKDDRAITLFKRMAARARIDHRYSFLEPHRDRSRLDTSGFYNAGAFPDTAQRMVFYCRNALDLASRALDKIELAQKRDEITHVIVTSCTGFSAPGLDLGITARYGLNPAAERTIIGFMGCHAALHGLKLARHIVRAEPDATVLMLNLEMCTLHLRPPRGIEELLSFILFGDGCAASLISAQPAGLALRSFTADIIEETGGHITWHIGQAGFEMFLSGKVPALIGAHLPAFLRNFAAGDGADIRHWAIHPGGRSILDAVQEAGGLTDAQMRPSREVLAACGNMSSPSIMFVLKRILETADKGGQGCAVAFGPGLSIEAMRFELAGGSHGQV